MAVADFDDTRYPAMFMVVGQNLGDYIFALIGVETVKGCNFNIDGLNNDAVEIEKDNLG